MGKVRLSVDLDDTLAGTIEEWIKEASAKLGREIKREKLTEYHLENVVDLDRETIRGIFKNVWEHYENVPLIDPYIPRTIEDLSSAFEIFIVTAAVGKKEEVVAWLNKYGIKYDKLIMVEHSKDKLTLSEEYNIPIFVDDNPILADMAISSNKKIVMIKQPWNLKFIDEHASGNLFAVSDWKEAEAVLRKISESMDN
jgi:5'(3')-deoxyribonucleotidase